MMYKVVIYLDVVVYDCGLSFRDESDMNFMVLFVSEQGVVEQTTYALRHRIKLLPKLGLFFSALQAHTDLYYKSIAKQRKNSKNVPGRA